MELKNKNKFIKYLNIIKYIPYIKYKTSINDEELEKIINILNTKGRYKRIYKTLDEIADYIDNYYSDCKQCDFKDNKCICHRNLKKDYINGCCRLCIYQSNKGCTTKNVACKLFNCTHVITNKKKIELKDIYLSKLLNPYQRFVLTSDYFRTIEQVTMDLYVGPICLLIRLITYYIYLFIRGKK